MLKLNKIYIFLTLCVFLQSVGFSQTKLSNSNVKWEGLSAKDGEFIVFMPEGYITSSGNEMYLGKFPGATRVKKQLKVARYINGVVLLMEYYQGNGYEIYKTLQNKEKAVVEKEGESNGFQFAQLSVKDTQKFEKTHFYYSKNGLYLLKGISKKEDDKILKGFFESVRLINEKKVVAPNAPIDATQTSLPKISEQPPIRLDDSMAIDAKESDRKPIVLFQAAPNFSFDMRQGLSDVRVKLKVLYSSSGKVSDVKVLEISSRSLENEAVKTAKKTVFIPAEKDGKLVSVYQNVEYSFAIGVR